jgi:hypothetical protein
LIALIIINYNQLPITWPRIRATIWTSQLFEELLNALNQAKKINDLRIGFISLIQINILLEKYCTTGEKELIISLNDFGSTEQCWILKCPEGKFEAPSTTLKWHASLDSTNSHLIPKFFQLSKFSYEELDGIDVSSCSLDDASFQILLEKIEKEKLHFFSASDNNLTDASIGFLTQFLNNHSISEFDISSNHVIQTDIQEFFTFLTSKNIQEVPKRIKISFEDGLIPEDSYHAFTKHIAKLIQKDTKLRQLHICGNLSANDCDIIVKSLPENHHLEELNFDCPISKAIESRNEKEIALAKPFVIGIANSLKKTLCSGNKNAFRSFGYPLLLKVFLYFEDVLTIWCEFESQLTSSNVI